jgi:hypothetical protein
MDHPNGMSPYGLALVRSRFGSRPRRWQRPIEVAVVLLALASGLLIPGSLSEQTAGRAASRPAEEFLMVPVRVHLLRAEKSPAVGTKLSREDVERILRKANGIWHAAGVHLWVESVVEEKPAVASTNEIEAPLPMEALKGLRPADSRAEGMFHVYYVGRCVVNGIYLGRDALFVQEAARLNPVPGGIDEPLPRVTSHEIGHALGLPHRQARTNLMASGTTGFSLSDAEIETARHAGYRLSWVERAEAFMNKADALAGAGRKDEARSRYRAIAGLPGESPLKERARARLGAL